MQRYPSRRNPPPHLDEVVITIAGKIYWLWASCANAAACGPTRLRESQFSRGKIERNAINLGLSNGRSHARPETDIALALSRTR